MRYIFHSGMLGSTKSKAKSAARIVVVYHGIEKGLTMPDFRPGFGRLQLLGLIRQCKMFISQFGITNVQLQHAVAVIEEYRNVHQTIGYELDEEILQQIQQLTQVYTDTPRQGHQNVADLGSFYEKAHAPFPDFAKSRASIRHYTSRQISGDEIRKAIDVARSTPSACNRQSVRVHLLTDKNQIEKILELQGGNRGFGHLAHNLIFITTDLRCYFGPNELTVGWVDGGMFAMTLIFALHHQKIATCALNCSFSVEKERQMRSLTGISKDESFVVMLTCGYPPDTFQYPASKRYDIGDILTIHDHPSRSTDQ